MGAAGSVADQASRELRAGQRLGWALLYCLSPGYQAAVHCCEVLIAEAAGLCTPACRPQTHGVPHRGLSCWPKPLSRSCGSSAAQQMPTPKPLPSSLRPLQPAREARTPAQCLQRPPGDAVCLLWLATSCCT